jgi:hypothetical protein
MKNKVCWYFNTKYSIEYVKYILDAHVKIMFYFLFVNFIHILQKSTLVKDKLQILLIF